MSIASLTTKQLCQSFVAHKSSKCKLKTFSLNHNKVSECVCSGIDVELRWPNQSTFQTPTVRFEIFFQNKKPLILDERLQIFNQAYFNIKMNLNGFIFQKLKGFDVNSFHKFSNMKLSLTSATIYDSTLAFFSNGRLLKLCQDFPLQTGSFLQAFHFYFVYFDNTDYKPMCPLGFANTKMNYFYLLKLTNTFYKKNIPEFIDLPNETKNIEASS